MKINWKELTFSDGSKNYSVDIIKLHDLEAYISIFLSPTGKWKVILNISHDLMTDPIDDEIGSYETLNSAKKYAEDFINKETFIFGRNSCIDHPAEYWYGEHKIKIQVNAIK